MLRGREKPCSIPFTCFRIIKDSKTLRGPPTPNYLLFVQAHTSVITSSSIHIVPKSGPGLTQRLEFVDGKQRQKRCLDHRRDDTRPEDSLLSFSVADVVGVYAEYRGDERSREENDRRRGEDRDGGLLPVLVGAYMVSLLVSLTLSY